MRVFDEIDLAHAAGTQLFDDATTGKGRTGGQCHRYLLTPTFSGEGIEPRGPRVDADGGGGL